MSACKKGKSCSLALLFHIRFTLSKPIPVWVGGEFRVFATHDTEWKLVCWRLLVLFFSVYILCCSVIFFSTLLSIFCSFNIHTKVLNIIAILCIFPLIFFFLILFVPTLLASECKISPRYQGRALVTTTSQNSDKYIIYVF